MNFEHFLEIIPKIRKSELPGIDSQFKMAPEMRKKLGKQFDIDKRKPKKSAVLALFYPKEEQMYMAFILRKTYKGVHSNQIGFPGGKQEEEDKDFKATALRETEEEIGVNPVDVKVFKQLSDIYIPPSNFVVKSFMGYMRHTPEFILQEEEVERLIQIPIKDILSEHYVSSKRITTSYAVDIDVPVFTFTEPVLWGATAMIVSEIKDILTNNLERN
ncbi:MAG: CoA pyrophosphatase [Flavobacteriaceae bacterium]|nr:CoA pyrophosphatase [Flavobacteriaceae bacterium]